MDKVREKAEAMQGNGGDRRRANRSGGAANDNHGPEARGSGPPVPASKSAGQDGAGGGAEARIDAAVMRLARLIGRQIAREEFDGLTAANDNAPEKEAHDR